MKKTWLIIIMLVAVILGLVNFILSSKIKKEISERQTSLELKQKILPKEISGSSQSQAPQLKDKEPAVQDERAEPLKGPQPN